MSAMSAKTSNFGFTGTETTAPAQGFFAPVAALFQAIAKRRQERQLRHFLLRDLSYLREQSDHMLRDVGLTQKQLWDDGIGLDTLSKRRL